MISNNSRKGHICIHKHDPNNLMLSANSEDPEQTLDRQVNQDLHSLQLFLHHSKKLLYCTAALFKVSIFRPFKVNKAQVMFSTRPK